MGKLLDSSGIASHAILVKTSVHSARRVSSETIEPSWKPFLFFVPSLYMRVALIRHSRHGVFLVSVPTSVPDPIIANATGWSVCTPQLGVMRQP